MENKEYEKFYPEIIEVAGVSRVTIPKSLIDVKGWKVGDQLKILARLEHKKENIEENKAIEKSKQIKD